MGMIQGAIARAAGSIGGAVLGIQRIQQGKMKQAQDALRKAQKTRSEQKKNFIKVYRDPKTGRFISNKDGVK